MEEKFSSLFHVHNVNCSANGLRDILDGSPGGGDSHMKMTGMLVGKLKLTPKGDQCGRGSGVI